MVSLQQIISWFKEGLHPSEDQFRQTWLSYWHKSEKIPQSQVFGLQDSLDTLSTGMIYKEPVQNLSDLATTYPNPQKGWSVQVINEKNADGNSFIYQWDGTQWNNTGMVGFPADTVKKAELDKVKEEIVQLGRDVNVYNVSYINQKYDYTANDARLAVPSTVRKQGMILVYKDGTNWIVEKFTGQYINDPTWTLIYNWISIVDGNALLKSDVDSGIYNCHAGQAVFAAFETNSEARESVPASLRKRGLIVRYLSNENSGWREEIFTGSSYSTTNRSYWKPAVFGDDSFLYLGDITSFMYDNPDGTHTCSFNPKSNTTGLNCQQKPYTKAYYTVLVKKGLNTFTNLITEASGTPLTITHQMDDMAQYIIYFNLIYYTAFFMPINTYIRAVNKKVEDAVVDYNSKLGIMGGQLSAIKDQLNSFKTALDPTLNVCDLTKLLDNINVVAFPAWSLNAETNAKTLIVPLVDYGTDVFIKISGFATRRYATNIIFLNKNMDPVPNGGSYNIPASSAYGVINPYWVRRFDYYYMAITLYRGVDYGNRNPANGYVWSDAEISQGYPDWLNDIAINFVQSNTNPPSTKIIQEKRPVFGDYFDKAKISMFGKAGKKFTDFMFRINGSTVEDCFNFLYGSDNHTDFNGASLRNVQDMIEFANSAAMVEHVDCIIDGGDISTPSYTSTRGQALLAYNAYYDVVLKSTVDFIQVCGNHDKHQELNTTVADALTNSELVAIYKNKTKHTADTLYEFIDYESKKVRVIKLDAFDYPLEDDGSGKVKYPLTEHNTYIPRVQMEWFINTLLSTPSGCSVIVASHLYLENHLVDCVTSLLSALKNKGSGTLIVDYTNEVKKPPVLQYSINYNFNGMPDVYPAILFTGHTHRDGYRLSNNIHVIGIGCQAMVNGVNTGNTYRIAYSENQNLFNMINLDTTNRKIYINRFGCDKNFNKYPENPISY